MVTEQKFVYLWNTSVNSFFTPGNCLPSGNRLAWLFFLSWQSVLVLAMHFWSAFHMVE
jgi:hypothetical protein